MNNYPKYQYSKFIGQDQIVVRSDDKEEFVKLVNFVKGFDRVEHEEQVQRIVSANVSADDFDNKHICPAHNVQMVSKVSSKTNKPYWSHLDTINGKRSICFGKGYK